MDGEPEHGRTSSVLLFVVPFLACAAAIGAYFAWQAWIAPPPHVYVIF